MSSEAKFTNRLIDEKSPYLLQHAHNPVNWYPWGEEAFQKARDENKPIFLSVGYSTCHWCHVMEHESFENESVADVLNKDFISIKVDREERPDVDSVYMTFVQATSGHGGWPMSVFLTPELKPFVGGTYFPPADSFGRPGFITVLSTIALQWKADSSKIMSSGTKILNAIQDAVNSRSSADAMPDSSCNKKLFDQFSENFDEAKGGFGHAPKFPQPVNLNFLLNFHKFSKDTAQSQHALTMVEKTLTAMSDGGIHDHVAQGFHRYSTDGDWHVPHFEKMLYDQGQLASVYADAYKVTKKKIYKDTLDDILLYVNRDLSHKDGGFFSAEDADSLPTFESTKKTEGAFCAWSYEELKTLLDKPVAGAEDTSTLFDLFAFHFGIEKDGNVLASQDPHGELKQQNVLIVRHPTEAVAEQFDRTESIVLDAVSKCKEILFIERLKRPKPHLDTKIVTAWNGLMISGFCKAAEATNNPAYVHRATKCAQFIKTHLINSDGRLLRSVYSKEKDSDISQLANPIQGFSSDYAFITNALLDLYEASLDNEWLLLAKELQDKHIELFWDGDDGGFYDAPADDPSILLRMKEAQDGAEPSASTVATSNLIRLADTFDMSGFREKAQSIFKLNSKLMESAPIALPGLLSSFYRQCKGLKQIVVVGDRSKEDTEAMLQEIRSQYIPNRCLIFKNGDNDSFCDGLQPLLSELKMIGGQPTIYLCENYTCSLPMTSIEDFQKCLN